MLYAFGCCKKPVSDTNLGASMSGGSTQRPPPVDEALLERFKADVKRRHGRLRGNYSSELENALEAYLDASDGGDVNDRLARLESDVETIRDALVDDSGGKKKKDSAGSVTKRRLRKIRATIAEETGESPKVHEKVVEMAIREHAGSSDPTLRQYKRMLTDNRDLFPHPMKESLYFSDSTEYVLAINAMAKGSKLPADEYDEILDEYGEDWWIEQQEDNDTDLNGFQ